MNLCFNCLLVIGLSLLAGCQKTEPPKIHPYEYYLQQSSPELIVRQLETGSKTFRPVEGNFKTVFENLIQFLKGSSDKLTPEDFSGEILASRPWESVKFTLKSYALDGKGFKKIYVLQTRLWASGLNYPVEIDQIEVMLLLEIDGGINQPSCGATIRFKKEPHGWVVADSSIPGLSALTDGRISYILR
ncbi:MAG: hypothetical protein SFY92_09165 [Verrucomicrobiae bacterium]|nr:hypothetical protein [Verrucomicrobiae bacterium]